MILFRSTMRVPGFEKSGVYFDTSLRAVQMIPFNVGSLVEVLQTVALNRVRYRGDR